MIFSSNKTILVGLLAGLCFLCILMYKVWFQMKPRLDAIEFRQMKSASQDDFDLYWTKSRRYLNSRLKRGLRQQHSGPSSENVQQSRILQSSVQSLAEHVSVLEHQMTSMERQFHSLAREMKAYQSTSSFQEKPLEETRYEKEEERKEEEKREEEKKEEPKKGPRRAFKLRRK